jgi:hypothetical protein
MRNLMSDLSEDSSCASWHFDTGYCPWELLRDATGPQYPVAKVPRCLVSAAPINAPFSRKMLCAEPQAS